MQQQHHRTVWGTGVSVRDVNTVNLGGSEVCVDVSVGLAHRDHPAVVRERSRSQRSDAGAARGWPSSDWCAGQIATGASCVGTDGVYDGQTVIVAVPRMSTTDGVTARAGPLDHGVGPIMTSLVTAGPVSCQRPNAVYVE
jgi:hypothetical protein